MIRGFCLIYRLFSELQTVLIIGNKLITLSDIKEISRELKADPAFSPNFNILTDVSDCELNITPEDINEYVNYINYEIKTVGSRKTAILTSNPVQVALSMLFSYLMQNTPVIPKVYSTLNAALSYISRDEASFGIMKKQYYELKGDFTVVTQSKIKSERFYHG